MLKWLSLFVAMTLVTSFGAGMAAAEESTPTTQKMFTVGVEDYAYAPHYFVENGRYSGFGRDVLDLFAKKEGYHFIYQPTPYLRMVQNLLERRIDFQYPDDPKWLAEEKRDHPIHYSDGVVGYVDGISRRQADIGKPLAALKRIAMPLGWTTIDYAPLAKQQKLIIDEANSVEGVMEMLLANRVDGIYLNADVVSTYMRALGKPDHVSFDKTLPYQFSYFCLSTIAHPDVIAEFNQFLVDNAAEIRSINAAYKLIYDIDPRYLQ